MLSREHLTLITSMIIPLFSSPLKQTHFFARRDRPTTQFSVRGFSHRATITTLLKSNEYHVEGLTTSVFDCPLNYEIPYGIHGGIARPAKKLIWLRVPLAEGSFGRSSTGGLVLVRFQHPNPPFCPNCFTKTGVRLQCY